MTITHDSIHFAPNTKTAAGAYALDRVPLAHIQPSRINPRKHFDETALHELAESVRVHGILEPLLVRPAPAGSAAQWEIVAGERRYRAAQLAGLETAPVRVLEDLDDGGALELALVENLLRQDLDPIEEAEGYRQLHTVRGLRQREIAERVNRSQPAIANALRLLELPEDVQARIRGGELSVSHGIALARYKDFPALVSLLAGWAVTNRWTSKHLESMAPFSDYTVSQVLHHELLFTWVRPHEVEVATCQACPFGAYRAGDSSSHGACLKPTHYEELKAERQAAERAELEAKIAAARAQAAAAAPALDGEPAPPALPALRDLPAAAYHSFWGKRPAGCDTSCPCNTQAVGWQGEIVSICTDLGRYRQLEAAARKAEKADKRATLKDRVAQLEERIGTAGDLDLRAVAPLAVAVLRGYGVKAPELRAAVARQLPDAKLEGLGHDGLIALLGGLDAAVVVRLAAEALLRSELVQRYDNDYGSSASPLTDWYLGDVVPAEET